MELLDLGRTVQGSRTRRPAGDNLRHIVEVSGANFPLMPGSRVTDGLRAKLSLLQVCVGGHATLKKVVRQHEHPVIQRMESSQCNKLEPVTHRR